MGGKVTWTDYGKYTIILGPDAFGECHELDMQGIKSTQLSPKLIHSLPSGLGIFESVFYDANQSNICFGGPHPIFTTAYCAAGFTVNHMDVMFTSVPGVPLDLSACPRWNSRGNLTC